MGMFREVNQSRFPDLRCVLAACTLCKYNSRKMGLVSSICFSAVLPGNGSLSCEYKDCKKPPCTFKSS